MHFFKSIKNVRKPNCNVFWKKNAKVLKIQQIHSLIFQQKFIRSHKPMELVVARNNQEEKKLLNKKW